MKISIQSAFLLVFISFSAFSQWNVTGNVKDSDGKPIPFANVYINNTSISTITDTLGNFKLKVPNQYQKIALVASFVGYTHQIKNVIRNTSSKTYAEFVLETSNLLKEVNISAKMDKNWKRNWRIFQEGLYGESNFVKDCKILNRDAIKITYNEDTKKVLATASEPIIIENLALGYRLRLQLEKFESDGVTTLIIGYKYFEKLNELNEKIRERQIRNRSLAYENSFRNFLVSLSHNKLIANGFEVYKINGIREIYLGKTSIAQEVESGRFKPVNTKQICIFDKDKNQYVLFSESPLLVFAKNTVNYISAFTDNPFKYSQIILPNGYCTFTENGWINSPNGMILYDFWGHEGYSSLLPDDYMIDSTITNVDVNEIKSKKTIASEDSIVRSLPKIQNQNTISSKNSTIKVEEKKEKDFLISPDFTVKLTESDRQLNIFEILRRIPGLMVKYDAMSGTYSLLFLGNNGNIGSNSSADYTPALLLDGVLYSGREDVLGMLNAINTTQIAAIGAVKYGNGAMFGARGATGTIMISTIK